MVWGETRGSWGEASRMKPELLEVGEVGDAGDAGEVGEVCDDPALMSRKLKIATEKGGGFLIGVA